MASNFFRKIIGLELEEKILNGGALLAIIGVFFPWIGNEIPVGPGSAYTGFQYYTSFLGLTIFLVNLFLLSLIIIPLAGGPVIIRRRYREIVRLCLTSATTLLTLSALSVLTKVILERRMEIRFGIYLTLIGCIVTVIYAFLRFQEQRRSQVQELFRHPEDDVIAPPATTEEEFYDPPPPPPPPPPSPVEDHRMIR